MNTNFLDLVMRRDNITKITICGSEIYRGLMEKYQAYYALKSNLIYMPVNYNCIKKEVETFQNSHDINKKIISELHNKNILKSDAILVVNGTNNDYNIDSDTISHVIYALSLEKIVMFTNVSVENLSKECYFNHDKTYPLYIFKSDEEGNE